MALDPASTEVSLVAGGAVKSPAALGPEPPASSLDAGEVVGGTPIERTLVFGAAAAGASAPMDPSLKVSWLFGPLVMELTELVMYSLGYVVAAVVAGGSLDYIAHSSVARIADMLRHMVVVGCDTAGTVLADQIPYAVGRLGRVEMNWLQDGNCSLQRSG